MRINIMAVRCVVIVLFMTPVAVLGGDRRVSFNIPAQSADKALTVFADQADLTLFFPYEIAKEKQSNALIGEFNVNEGLKILLQGSGLLGTVDGDSTLKISVDSSLGGQENVNRETGLFAAAATLLGSLATTPVETRAQGGLLEEIIVEARRYEESLQDVPLSVSAMTDDYLEAQGINNVNEVLEASPSATFVRFNKFQHEYSIRGIGSQTEGASGDSSVQSVLDNVVISKDFMKNPAMFDVERVEVLRGPQGTSFGRNASAGLVHIISKRPTEEFEAGITVGAAEFDTYSVQAYASNSLSDNLAGRLAFNYESTDGYMENLFDGENLNGEENVAIRGSLVWNPTSDIEVYLKAEYNRDDDETVVRRSADCSAPFVAGPQPPGPPGPGTIFSPAGPPLPSYAVTYTDPCDVWTTTAQVDDRDFFMEREMFNLTAEITWSINDALTLTSITGYIDGSNDYLQNGHGGPLNLLWQENHNDADMLSQEVRIDNHAAGDRLRWLAGIYYMQDDHERFDQNILFGGAPDTQILNREETHDVRENANETESIGLFGEISYDITDQFNGTFGIRWSQDDKDYRSRHFGWGDGGPLDTLGTGTANVCNFSPGPIPVRRCGTAAAPIGLLDFIPVSDSWDEVTLKGSLQYQVNDNLMVYFLYSEGYKTGGFQNEPFSVADATTAFQPETSTLIEGGFKAEWGGRFRVNGSIYDIDYEDLQVFQFVSLGGQGFAQRVSNLKGVDVFGFDLETVLQITDQLRLTGNFSNIDAELQDGTLVTLDTAAGPTDLGGTRPDNSPEWTGTVAVEYTFPFSDGSSLTLRGDWRGRSEVFDDIGELPERERPAVDVFGFRGTYNSASDKWSASLYVKNLTEEEEIIQIGPLQPNTLQLPTAFGIPRIIGGSVTYRF